MTAIDKALGISPQVLALRAQRMNLLSSNIANADTPGYKARDIDFAAALEQAKATQENAADPLCAYPSKWLSDPAGRPIQGAIGGST